MSNVKSLYGGPTGTPQVNETCVAELRRLLEAAEAGEIIGFVAGALHKDGCAAWRMAGMVGGYSLIGALEVARTELVHMVAEGDV